MGGKYTVDEMVKCSKQELMLMVLAMQEQMERMNENLENLIEQIRVANLKRFGRHTEKMSELDGQLSFFNEAEYYSEDAGEPELEEVLPQKERSKKQKGKREADLKDFSEEMHDHDVAEKQLNEVFGEGNWREMPAEEYKRLRYEPASWTVGQLKTIKCMYMWVRMAAIRMNSFVGTVPRIFCATVSLRRL